jgi:hypothetical protein
LGPELRRSFEVGINLDVLTDTVGVAKSRRIRSGGHRSFLADAAARLSDYEVGLSFPSNRGGFLYVAGWPGVILA